METGKTLFVFLSEWGSVPPPPLAEISAKNKIFLRAPLARLLLLDALSRVHNSVTNYDVADTEGVEVQTEI